MCGDAGGEGIKVDPPQLGWPRQVLGPTLNGGLMGICFISMLYDLV